MTNLEALKALSEGKCVRHIRWCGDGHLKPGCTFSPSYGWACTAEWYLTYYTDGWEVYEPEEPGHDWAWACEQMLAGKKVRRKLWIAGHWYQLQLGLKSVGCYRELYEPGPGRSRDRAGLYAICDRRATVSEADFKATDWVLADEGVKP